MMKRPLYLRGAGAGPMMTLCLAATLLLALPIAALASQDPAPGEQTPTPEEQTPAPIEPDQGSGEASTSEPVVEEATERADAERLREALAQLRERGAFSDLQVVLEELAVRHPEAMEIVEVGRSVGDRPLLFVRLGRVPGNRPSMLVCPELDRPNWGAESVDWIEAWLAAPNAAERGPIWLIPAPDPDGMRVPLTSDELEATADTTPGLDQAPLGDASDSLTASSNPATSERVQLASVALDRDFPIGWRPDQSGYPTPFQRIETKLIARALLARSELALVILLGERGRSEARLPALEAEGVELLTALSRIEGVLLPGPDSQAPGGSLAAFCAGRMDLPVLVLERGLDPVAAVHALDELALGVPRLELEVQSTKSVGDGVWQVEFSVRNAGALGTSGRGRSVLPREEVLAQWSGASLSFAAVRRVDSVDFAPVEAMTDGLPLGALAGGDIRWVRLYLEAAHGAALELSCSAPRAGTIATRLILGE
ncbi:MAG: hypothetical protein ACI841_003157 [Planctomycetota bacterium]|jgi:hypothetical protein